MTQKLKLLFSDNINHIIQEHKTKNTNTSQTLNYILDQKLIKISKTGSYALKELYLLFDLKQSNNETIEKKKKLVLEFAKYLEKLKYVFEFQRAKNKWTQRDKTAPTYILIKKLGKSELNNVLIPTDFESDFTKKLEEVIQLSLNGELSFKEKKPPEFCFQDFLVTSGFEKWTQELNENEQRQNKPISLEIFLLLYQKNLFKKPLQKGVYSLNDLYEFWENYKKNLKKTDIKLSDRNKKKLAECFCVCLHLFGYNAKLLYNQETFKKKSTLIPIPKQIQIFKTNEPSTLSLYAGIVEHGYLKIKDN